MVTEQEEALEEISLQKGFFHEKFYHKKFQIVTNETQLLIKTIQYSFFGHMFDFLDFQFRFAFLTQVVIFLLVRLIVEAFSISICPLFYFPY